MKASDEVRVVLAAGGLGTRVHHWARYLPKEFHPVGGRPGITWILEEIAGLGAAHIVRARVTADFIRFARAFPIAPDVEPKLALTIGAYAATHSVVAVETSCEVIDVGAPVCRCERSHLRVAKPSARQGVTISDDPFLTES